MNATREPEIVADYANHTGECPLWHAAERLLYWVDIPQGRVFRYDPASNRHEIFYEGSRQIGGFTIQRDGALLLFMDRGAIGVLRDGRLSYLVDEIPAERDTRFNDVIAAPDGGVFCGTMPTETRKATLYRLDSDGSLSVAVEGVGLSNGMGFTSDGTRMYYTDSFARRIYLFDYDAATGALSNRRVFVETPRGEGIPDGMTVDAEGHVWSARVDGSALFRYTPRGEEERRIRFPARKVSSAAFGGGELDEIYVTTIGGNDKAAEGAGAGALFRLRLGIRGRPEYLSDVSVRAPRS